MNENYQMAIESRSVGLQFNFDKANTVLWLISTDYSQSIN